MDHQKKRPSKVSYLKLQTSLLIFLGHLVKVGIGGELLLEHGVIGVDFSDAVAVFVAV